LKILDQIHNAEDVCKLQVNDLQLLCEDLRAYLIKTILENGGHFSANLGVVELTVALNHLFDWKRDTLVWDVGHQSYVHKILNSRKNALSTIRKKGGISGFPNILEHPNDFFGTGHSSTSISAVMGFAIADYLDKKDNHWHIAVIGDGSLTGGMAFEALNNLSKTKANVLVIVNDNQMGIDENKNGIAAHLKNIEQHSVNFFTSLGLNYWGPIDGHDLPVLIKKIQKVKTCKGPQILHIRTQKGKGYLPAETEQTRWHSVNYVKIEPHVEPVKNTFKVQQVFGSVLLELAEKDTDVVAITPAMPSGSSLNLMMQKFPDRVFDVGIAEQHAVTFSSGLALRGKKVFCVIYSSFLQRAYDQIIHDVALQNIPLIICVDRAGLVGEDGATHQGVFDLAFLKIIPNLTIISPMNPIQLRTIMHWAINQNIGPIIIRYPKGNTTMDERYFMNAPSVGQFFPYQFYFSGPKIAIVSHGFVGEIVQECVKRYQLENQVTHLDLTQIKPLNNNILERLFVSFNYILTVEETALLGGLNDTIKIAAVENNYVGVIESLGVADAFVEHATMEEQRELYGITVEKINDVLGNWLG